MSFLRCAIQVMALFLFMVSTLQAETVRFAFSAGKPAPYVIDEFSGIEVEIVREAFEAVGIDVEPVWLTYKRMAYIGDMALDGRGVTKPNKNDGLFYSDPYIYYQDVALTRSSSAIRLESIMDMAGFRVGAWQTATQDFGGDFERLFGDKGPYEKDYYPVYDDYRRIRMLWLNRLDIVVTDLLIFDHFTQQIERDTKMKLPYDIHRLWVPKHWFFAAFKTRKHRDFFNQGLRIIRSKGLVDEIYRKYSGNISR